MTLLRCCRVFNNYCVSVKEIFENWSVVDEMIKFGGLLFMKHPRAEFEMVRLQVSVSDFMLDQTDLVLSNL